MNVSQNKGLNSSLKTIKNHVNIDFIAETKTKIMKEHQHCINTSILFSFITPIHSSEGRKLFYISNNYPRTIWREG